MKILKALATQSLQKGHPLLFGSLDSSSKLWSRVGRRCINVGGGRTSSQHELAFNPICGHHMFCPFLNRERQSEAGLHLCTYPKHDFSTVSRRWRKYKSAPQRSMEGANQKSVRLYYKISLVCDAKEDIQKQLDKLIALEASFPIASIKQTLMILKREEKWDRICVVTKWMLQKGKGKTMGSYELLLEAFDKLGRAEEAKLLWKNTISKTTGSVPARMVSYMIDIFDRHDMPEQVIKLFICMEQLGRKLSRDTVVKAASAFDRLGYFERKNQILRKYDIGMIEKGKD